MITLLMIGLADVSPPRLPVERLGSEYRYLRQETDRGLDVGVWMNLQLRREERWHWTDGDYFLQVSERVYVRGRHDGTEWVTDSAERLVLQGDRWARRPPPRPRD